MDDANIFFIAVGISGLKIILNEIGWYIHFAQLLFDKDRENFF
jgi:hypothetical protein